MKACNGNTDISINEAVEITRLEPVIIEVEEGNRISSHLMIFEIICRMNFTDKELIVNGEVQETIFETQAREED
ncbi:hypothetical protein JW756_03555 [Candidatus Woesearchaeota archaeon]|nr:hypothetical protein [Candidatus Woesearchaeota archaeon]